MHKNNNFKKNFENKINSQIRHREVRVVGNESEDLNGVMSTRKALELSESMGLDLIEISPNANPPVCKIMDYSKFKYDKKKKIKEQSKNKNQLKEMKFGPNIGKNDFDFKKKNVEKFLNQGHKVKATVQFKGRENAYRDRGELTLLKLAEEVGEKAKIEQLPKMQGRQMIMFLSPKK